MKGNGEDQLILPFLDSDNLSEWEADVKYKVGTQSLQSLQAPVPQSLQAPVLQSSRIHNPNICHIAAAKCIYISRILINRHGEDGDVLETWLF